MSLFPKLRVHFNLGALEQEREAVFLDFRFIIPDPGSDDIDGKGFCGWTELIL